MNHAPATQMNQVQPHGWWQRLMEWTPTDKEIEVIGDVAHLLDVCVKGAVIAAALYFAFEVGTAFLPGGPAWRVLGGW